MIRRITLFSVGLATVLALTLVITACDSGNASDSTDQRLNRLEEQTTKAQVLAALDVIDRAGFHSIDTDLQKATTINSQYLSTIRKSRQAVTAITWPEELQPKADDFRVALEDFQKALEANNLADAKAAATKAHDTSHELTNDAWPWVAGEKAAGEHE